MDNKSCNHHRPCSWISGYQEEGTLKLQAFATWTPCLIYLVIVLCIAYFIISFYQHFYGGGSELDQAIHGFGN